MQKLLIVGAGDVARRTLPLLNGRYRIFALLRDPAQDTFWRRSGVRPIGADLDHAASLKRLSGLADVILHFAPPPATGAGDPRMRRLIAALRRGRSLPRRFIYVSTTGIYGDCAGARIDETRPARPATARAKRRVDAERQLRRFGVESGVRISILRAPGIYAEDRLPIERLQKRLHALTRDDDVFTNHIHADDLAQLVASTLRLGRANRCYNASDDTEMRMGDYFDLVADTFELPRPPRVSRREARDVLTPIHLSFMSESRRLDNQRIKRELRVRLRYAQVADGIVAARKQTEK